MDLHITAEDLLEAFNCLYNKINSKSLSQYQPHEILIILSEIDFCDVIYQISHEICELEDCSVDSPTSDSYEGLYPWIIKRGYLSECDLMTKDFNTKSQLLYEIIHDLITVRLVTKKSLNDELILSSFKAIDTGDHIIQSVNNISNYLGITPCITNLAAVPDQLSKIDDSIDITKLRFPHHLLVPKWPETLSIDLANRLINCLAKEYKCRRKVLSKRLDVTIAAFLWSPKCQVGDSQIKISQVIQRSLLERHKLEIEEVTLWDVLSATRQLLHYDAMKVSGEKRINDLKRVTIGNVPNRGGVPEGYTLQDVHDDVIKANQQLQQKDQREAEAKRRSAQASQDWGGNSSSSPQTAAQRPQGRGGNGWPPRGGGSPWTNRGGNRGGRGGGGYNESGRMYGDNCQNYSYGGAGSQNYPNQNNFVPSGQSGRGARSGFGGRVQDQPATASWMQQPRC